MPIIPVDNLAARISQIAAIFFNRPAEKFALVGITGTNGKTSVCQFIAESISGLGHVCGTSGTLGYGIYGSVYAQPGTGDGPGTTPDPVTVQRIFSEMLQKKADIMVMEASSHGLKQGRVCINEFDIAVFTNLSRDHLDYHSSMQSYGEAKLKLFSGSRLGTAVLNMDDLFTATILNSLSRQVKIYTYSVNNQQADVYAENIDYRRKGFSLQVSTPWGKGELETGLLGSFNVSNLLAVLTTVMVIASRDNNFDVDRVFQAVSDVSPVKGRMELVGDKPVSVVVDYAHTPDALENSLQALHEHFKGNIWCVFGCGGDRDKGKRPMMARIAENLADRVIVTDDNPRQESSSCIIEQIVAGFSHQDSIRVESDRARAIDYAIANAAEGDVVLIAGKGHEEYQDVGSERLMFSDVKQARLSLNKRFTE